jgi:hypothetical protein
MDNSFYANSSGGPTVADPPSQYDDHDVPQIRIRVP